MAELDFPSNPAELEHWTDPNGVEWEFKGYGWKEYKIPPLQTLTDVSPAIPNVGDKLVWTGEIWEPQLRQITMDSMSDISGTPSADDYMVYDGTNWGMSSDNNEFVYACYSTTNFEDFAIKYRIIGVNRIEYSLIDYVDVLYDTHGMTNVAKDRITITQDGLYKLTLLNNFQEGNPSTDRYMKARLYVRNPATGATNLHFWETGHHGNITENMYTHDYLCETVQYANLKVGDYIFAYWLSGARNYYNPLYAKNLYLSAHKINVQL